VGESKQKTRFVLRNKLSLLPLASWNDSKFCGSDNSITSDFVLWFTQKAQHEILQHFGRTVDLTFVLIAALDANNCD